MIIYLSPYNDTLHAEKDGSKDLGGFDVIYTHFFNQSEIHFRPMNFRSGALEINGGAASGFGPKRWAWMHGLLDPHQIPLQPAAFRAPDFMLQHVFPEAA